jgi:hypothetical protein
MALPFGEGAVQQSKPTTSLRQSLVAGNLKGNTPSCGNLEWYLRESSDECILAKSLSILWTHFPLNAPPCPHPTLEIAIICVPWLLLSPSDCLTIF